MTSVHIKKAEKIKKAFINEPRILTINLHIFPFCNYRCRFCFQQHLFNHFAFKEDTDYYKQMITRIYESVEGINNKVKLTISGGEPTLYPNLKEILQHSKKLGFITSIITNGSRPNVIKEVIKYIDILGVSIDSYKEEVEIKLGRGNGYHLKKALKTVEIVKNQEKKLKINTVVTKLNYKENMCEELISKIKPDVWKVFKVEFIKGINNSAKELAITKSEFIKYIKLNKNCRPKHEDSDLLRNSYIMIDPEGRVFQNRNGEYIWSTKTIFETDLFELIAEVGLSVKKYKRRYAD